MASLSAMELRKEVILLTLSSSTLPSLPTNSVLGSITLQILSWLTILAREAEEEARLITSSTASSFRTTSSSTSGKRSIREVIWRSALAHGWMSSASCFACFKESEEILWSEYLFVFSGLL